MRCNNLLMKLMVSLAIIANTVSGQDDPAGIVCMDHFSFTSEERYIVSVWTKEVPATPPSVLDNYDHAGIIVEFQTNSGTVELPTMTASGNILDGWQQITGLIDVPAEATSATIKLINTYFSAGDKIYYDDFRMFPFEANMVSYVYDPVSLKYIANLDENNYAAFYTYDEEGNLSGVKRETEKGIISVNESRRNLPKYIP